MVKTVNLIGPIEPTGLSWLINCLLELNIRCSMGFDTWNQFDGKFQLKPEKEPLRRWLPALSDPAREFNFRNDIEVNWSHDWVNAQNIENQTVFFSREPKTALFSAYKRLGSTPLSFYNYLNEIDPQWLLNRMQIWNLFHGLWSLHPEVKVFLFEDYKTNAIRTLELVIEFLQIGGIEKEELNRAVNSSSFEMAKRSEEEYLKESKAKITPMIRQGSLNIENEASEWRAYELIDLECSQLFEKIKNGTHVENYLRTSNLNSYIFDYLERNESLEKYFPNFHSVDERLSAYRHISIESIVISKQNSNYKHLISAIQRTLVLNALHDLKALSALKNVKFPPSNISFGMSLLSILIQAVKTIVSRSIFFFKNH